MGDIGRFATGSRREVTSIREVVAEVRAALKTDKWAVIPKTASRSLFETWLCAYYIRLGGIDAFEAVIAGHAYALEKQRSALTQHEEAG